MILPADTKAPIPDTEQEYRDNPNEVTPQSTSRTPVYFTRYADEEGGEPQPLPTTTSVHAGLPHSIDAELGPAPPYSPPSEELRVGERKERGKKRFWALLALAVVLWIFVTLGAWKRFVPSSPPWRSGDRNPQNPNRPPPSHGPRPGPPKPGPESDRQWDRDGNPVGCAEFDPSDYSPFPLSHDQPNLPGEIHGSGYRRSTNKTLFISTKEPQLFTHLVGSASVGSVFYSTYNPDETFDSDRKNGGIWDGDIHKGEYVKVIVESIYDVLPYVGMDEDTTEENSPGWEWLMLSKICLMKRDHPVFRTGEDTVVGVGVYTSRPEHSRHPQNGTPLQFRIHIFLPTSSQNSFFDLIPSPPRGFIKSFEVFGWVLSSLFHDIRAAQIGKLDLKSSVGQYEFRNVTASQVKIDTTGSISGSIGIAGWLDIHATVGSVSLDLSITTPPPFVDIPPPELHGDKPSRALISASDKCPFPPVSVEIQSESGSVDLTYKDWADACRPMHQNIQTSVGSVSVRSHPIFEGPFRLSSSIGSISVDSKQNIPDPLGQDRTRQVTVRKNNHIGSRLYTGEVKWVNPSSMEDLRSDPEGSWEDVQRGMTIGTQVGSISLRL